MSHALLSLSRVAAPREPLEGSDIADAREAFEFWSARAERLPWHRRAARREAREMATRWRARLVAAHLERWRLRRLGTALAPLLDTRGRRATRHAGRLAYVSMRRSRIGRRLLLATGAMAAASLLCLVAAVLMVAQLAGL